MQKNLDCRLNTKIFLLRSVMGESEILVFSSLMALSLLMKSMDMKHQKQQVF